jgi:hypothetical protein
VLGASERRLPVTVGEGTHARIALRGVHALHAGEASVEIDGVPIHVHTLSGLPSYVALSAGEHRFKTTRGGPVLARIELPEPSDCSMLRDLQRWAVTRPSVAFDVPGGETRSVARVLVDAASLEHAARQLVLQTTSQTREAWVRPPASGSLELPIEPADVRLTATSAAALRVRASARLSTQRAAHARRSQRASSTRAETQAEIAERVRAATRGLRTVSDEPARRLYRQRRADALSALGYARLAEIDRRRALGTGVERLLDAQSDEALGLHLPRDAGSVVPIGLASRVVPLPAPPAADARALARARARITSGHAPEAVVNELLASAKTSSAADALLLAHAAERAGLKHTAARALERVGLTHASGAALAAAASLYADVAAAEGDVKLTAYAHALARRAVELGDPAVAALGKLTPAISWVMPTAASSLAGSAAVEHTAAKDSAAALWELVRRALLDAPDDAILLSGRRQLELRTSRRAAFVTELTLLCHALGGDSENCSVGVELDGRRVACDTPGETSRVPRLQRCQVAVPAGEHRLNVALPASVDALGWVRAGDLTGQRPLEAHTVSDWIEIDERHPLRMEFAGPTVLRLTARAPSEQPRTLALRVGRRGDKADASQWPVPPGTDPAARRIAPERALAASPAFALGPEAERSIAVIAAGPHFLDLESPGGRVLVRVEAAVARTAPVPREAPGDSTPALEPRGSSSGGSALPRPPAIGHDPGSGFGMLAGYAGVTEAELVETDRDDRSRYGEAGLRLYRELAPGRFWIELGTFGRVRDGPESYGADASLDFSGPEDAPDAFARAEAVVQPNDGQTLFGYRALGGVSWPLRLDSELRLVPSLTHTLRHVDERGRELGAVDSDVYASYSATHPNSSTAGIRLDQRPLIDTILRYGLQVRSNPDLAGVDRTDARVELDTLPGEGLMPWLGLTVLASYRPRGELRDEGFVRFAFTPSAFFWHWASRLWRITADVRATYLIDVPQTARSGSLSGLLVVALEYTGGRGLRDHAPRERPFRDRLEEGSGVARRSAGPRLWSPAP